MKGQAGRPKPCQTVETPPNSEELVFGRLGVSRTASERLPSISEASAALRAISCHFCLQLVLSFFLPKAGGNLNCGELALLKMLSSFVKFLLKLHRTCPAAASSALHGERQPATNQTGSLVYREEAAAWHNIFLMQSKLVF